MTVIGINTEELLMRSEVRRLANASKYKSIQKVNVKYKEIGSGKDRAGIIRQINNIKALKPETKIPNKKLKSSSSLPALKYDSKIPEKKMINIFENCKSAWC